MVSVSDRGCGSPEEADKIDVSMPELVELRSNIRRCRGLIGFFGMERPLPLITAPDDRQPFCKALGRFLRAQEFDVAVLAVGEELLSEGLAVQPDCLVKGLQMPGLSGSEVPDRPSAKKTGIRWLSSTVLARLRTQDG
jgi:hypothetical protein